jgi:hypothetical protein
MSRTQNLFNGCIGQRRSKWRYRWEWLVVLRGKSAHAKCPSGYGLSKRKRGQEWKGERDVL